MARRVVVIGGGNAALCAAIAAREVGADVIVLERASEMSRGGNTAFTAGAMRVVYENMDDIKSLVPDLSDGEISQSDFGHYTAENFYHDIARVTNYRADPELASILVTESLPTLRWMVSHGVRFVPIYGRQAFQQDGRFVFWGGLTFEVVGGGIGLIEFLTVEAKRIGVDVRYGSRAIRLLREDNNRIVGVKVQTKHNTETICATEVILAAGGFQANPEWRTRYLGSGWDLAKVRGTRYNTGDGIRMALEVGAASTGNWSGCHAVAWDFNAPEFGDLAVGDGFQKHSYPFGVMVNELGRRFVDEGADFRNYTYAKYGQEILRQPHQRAWQIFDQKVAHLLRDEYRIRQITRCRANTLEDLASQMDGLDTDVFLSTIATYNASVQTQVPFDPNRKDGRSTAGIDPPKSNWANTIDSPPFEAYDVTCGITFTFGGVKINEQAAVLDEEDEIIDGLYACGEMVGGIFYFNYPGGSGLTAGSVFGRIAGREAARHANQQSLEG